MLDVKGCSKAEIKKMLLRVWLRQVAIGLLIFAVGCVFLTSSASQLSLAGGALWGALDAAVLLGGTASGLERSFWESKQQRWRIFFCRLATGVAIIAGMLCLKLRVAETFIVYLVLHICFFVNLQYFTNPRK